MKQSLRRISRRRLLVRTCCAGLASLAFAGSPALADVKLPAVLSDHMVLQQGQPVPIWGWADAGEAVTVQFAGQSQKATTGAAGRWSVKLEPLKASDQGAELTVTGKNTVKRTDVLVGEVWVCSGQSNMVWLVRNSKDAEKEISAANHPKIRLLTVADTIADEPASDMKVMPGREGQWLVCSPETVPNFSAVGYYFGRELHQKLNVPVGLIKTCWGGTPAESWTPKAYLEKEPDLQQIMPAFQERVASYPQMKARYEQALARWTTSAEKAKQAGEPEPKRPNPPKDPTNDPWKPASLYNGMIAPLVPFAQRGTIWYQGESNANRAHEYRTLLPTMIQGWRDAWAAGGAKGDFSFLIVQLANFRDLDKEAGDDDWAELREAQTLTAALPNNGMALAIDLADIDNPSDIHPKNKQDVGRRLALVALAKTYGQNVPYSGPVFDSMKIEGNQARITFKHADGLTLRPHGGQPTADGKVSAFQIAGQDKKWHWADAKIDGQTVVVSSPSVPKPAAVRYAWSTNPGVNLYNAAGLPAAPFRTDDWPMITAGKK